MNLDTALLASRKQLNDLFVSAGFAQLCRERGLDTEAIDDPNYWAAVADYAHDIDEWQEQQGVSAKDRVLNELSADTPDFIYTQRYLDRHRRDFSETRTRRYHFAKETMSHFNGLVRTAAREWPELRPSDLENHLLAVAQACIPGDHLQEVSENYLRDAIRGAQHEVAFGQLLHFTGFKFRPARLDEDLHGIDYIGTKPNGQLLYIDVKASLRKVDSHHFHHQVGRHAVGHHVVRHDQLNQEEPHFKLYTRTYDGHLVMFSTISDFEFQDSFYLADDLAARKGAYLRQLLAKAEPSLLS